MKFLKAAVVFMAVVVVALSGGLVIKNLNTEKVPDANVTSKITVTDENGKEKEMTLTSINPLTGVDDLSAEALGKRPVAIMINNIKRALPQYGVYDADMMFEIPVEGGITRMMALYADYTKIPDVCSVRSCRYYFPIFAHGFDAVYFCFGSNQSLATPMLKQLGIDYFDGAANFDQLVFGRDPERLNSYPTEHTGYVKGPSIPSLLEKYNIRTDRKTEKNAPVFNFTTGTKEPVGVKVCDKVSIKFSNSYFSTFLYRPETGTYVKYHSGEKHMDQRAGKQLEFTNVFVLQTTVSLHENGPLMDVDWKGGTGFYASAGTACRIRWEKPTAESDIKIYDTEGKEITVNAGKSYFAIVNPSSTSIRDLESIG